MGIAEENGTTFSDQTGPTNRNGSRHFEFFYRISSWVLSIMPKIPEISVGIQMERFEFVSVSSDRNIRDHLWRWSTYFGQNIPIEIRCSSFDKRVLSPN